MFRTTCKTFSCNPVRFCYLFIYSGVLRLMISCSTQATPPVAFFMGESRHHSPDELPSQPFVVHPPKPMPALLPHPCKKPGCPYTTTERYCHMHRHYRTPRRKDNQRPSSAQRGYTWAWQKARRLFLKDHPLCNHCLEVERTTAATVVDHIEPHCGDPMRFWDRSNWQALCKRCHDRKTATEERPDWY